MAEMTFALIKPDAIAMGNTGSIIEIIELNKFKIERMEKVRLSAQQAEEFYGVHRERPFFGELVAYVISGPVVLLALSKENAVKEWRDLMGATDPVNAGPGTIRRMFGTSIGSNAVHGSDSAENAKIELKFFFPDLA